MPVKAEVVDRDLGWRELMKRVAQIKNSYAKVGVFDEGEHEGSELSVAEVAAVHEFGTEDGHIPERSFLRSTFNAHREELIAIGVELMGRIVDGAITAERALNMMGASLAAQTKATIARGVPPPNALSTLLKKARTGRTAKFFRRKARHVGDALAQVGALAAVKPLIDTGRMIGSITWAVVVRGRPE